MAKKLEDFNKLKFYVQDGDVIWFRNPFAVFSTNMDFQVSTDRYGGTPFDLHHQQPNSGFLFVRSNNRTIEMYKYWYEARLRNPGKNDQNVLTAMFEEEAFGSQVGVTVQLFDTVFFSGFCSVRTTVTLNMVHNFKPPFHIAITNDHTLTSFIRYEVVTPRPCAG